MLNRIVSTDLSFFKTFVVKYRWDHQSVSFNSRTLCHVALHVVEITVKEPMLYPFMPF